MCKWLGSQKLACYERKQKTQSFSYKACHHSIENLLFGVCRNHLLQKWLAYLKTFKGMYLFLQNNTGVGPQIVIYQLWMLVPNIIGKEIQF